MRKAIAGPLTTLAALVMAAPAGAITNGSADGNRHPEVGAMLAQQARSDGTWTRCTGTLVSSTVVLTAAYCEILGVSRVHVTFESQYVYPQARPIPAPGTPTPHIREHRAIHTTSP